MNTSNHPPLLPSVRSNEERDQLVSQYYRWACAYGVNFHNRWKPLSPSAADSIQWALMGLTRAAELWDGSVEFRTYAHPAMNRTMRLGVAYGQMVHCSAGLDYDHIKQRHKLVRPYTDLIPDGSVVDELTTAYCDPVPDFERDEVIAVVRRSLRVLSPSHMRAVGGFLEGNTLEQTSKRHGISRERVRQLLEKAFEQLRRHIPEELAW